jgi:hypothetical protein
LSGADPFLPAPVKVKHGTGRSGKRLHFHLNYSNEAQNAAYSYAAGTDLLTGAPVGQSIALWPRDAAIVEEKKNRQCPALRGRRLPRTSRPDVQSALTANPKVRRYRPRQVS